MSPSHPLYFKETDDTDVIVKIRKQVLHLHSNILSFYSPILKEAIQHQQKVTGNLSKIELIIGESSWLASKAQRIFSRRNTADEDADVTLGAILFFMFFYPEHKHKLVHGKF